MNTKDKGEVAEALALYRMIQAGYSVSDPWGDNQRFDFLAEKDGEIQRVQVKYGEPKDGYIEFRTCSVNLRTQEKEDYKGEADLFALSCPERDEVYLMEVEEAGVSSTRIRFGEPNKASPNINWAEDYRAT